MQQERYEAAIEDLRLAAEAVELKPLVEKNLAIAYKALGKGMSPLPAQLREVESSR